MRNVRRLIGQSYLQNTNLTILGMFREGFFVSPAVIPKLSVPPTAEASEMPSRDITTTTPTGKTGSDEHTRKSAESADERRTGDVPILASNIFV